MGDTNELERLNSEIAALQSSKKQLLQTQRTGALKQAKEIIRTHRFTIVELGLKKRFVKKRLPKYSNPEDSTQTYAGGAKPLWVRRYEEKGGSLQDLLIKK